MTGIDAKSAAENNINPRTKTRNARGPAIFTLPANDATPFPIDSSVWEIYSYKLPPEEISDPKIFTAKLKPIKSSTIESKRLKTDRNALIVLIIDFHKLRSKNIFCRGLE